MIELGQKAWACCDAPGCRNKQPATLVLLASGGAGFIPRSGAWQFAKSPAGVFVTRCPEHQVAASAIPDAATATPAPVPADP